MSGASFERGCRVEAAVAVARAAGWLEKNGYEIVARSTVEMHLFHSAGSSNAVRIDQGKHRLNVRSDGRNLTFTVEPGVPSPTVLSDAERTELERRVDAATAAAHAQIAAAAVRAPDAAPHCALWNDRSGGSAHVRRLRLEAVSCIAEPSVAPRCPDR